MKGTIGGTSEKPVYKIDGREVSKKEFDAAFPDQSLAGGNFGGHLPGNWPMLSDGLAVHPDQVHEANERNRRAGINVTYEPQSGRAILPDRNERKKLLKYEGFRDNHGGYGD
jgi:hypothetical protein